MTFARQGEKKKSQESMHWVCNNNVSMADETLRNPTCKVSQKPDLIKPQFSLLTPHVHRLIRSQDQGFFLGFCDVVKMVIIYNIILANFDYIPNLKVEKTTGSFNILHYLLEIII